MAWIPNRQCQFLVDATTHGGISRGEAIFRFLPAPAGDTWAEPDADVELGGGSGLTDFFRRGMDHWMQEVAAGRRSSTLA